MSRWTLIINERGTAILGEGGKTRPYRWYHRLVDAWDRRFSARARGWNALQNACPPGTRFYGDGGTVHSSTELDIEVSPMGFVVAVWFRCQPLPFKVADVDHMRAQEMNRMYEDHPASGLHGVVVENTDVKPHTIEAPAATRHVRGGGG